MLVETHDLTKRYGRLTALDRCTLAVAEGEIFGLLGPNGSGKTTLLRLLMGYLRPTAGSATVDGLDCYHHSVAVHERVAYLPGEAKLFPQMRGRDVLAFFARVRPDGDLDRALALADRLDLDLSRPVSLMSTGMRQKTALAAVLSSSAPLLILDEPTTNLDPTARSEVLAIAREAKVAGKTILFSSHVLGEVEETCDRVVILRRGEVVHEQIMHELRRQHRIRARLTGPLPPTPEHFNGALQITQPSDNDVLIDTPGELAPLLGWLATMPLAEMRIEPVRLQTVYERFHGGTRA
jgi:ABC-2 type transport system ATP-binding protein